MAHLPGPHHDADAGGRLARQGRPPSFSRLGLEVPTFPLGSRAVAFTETAFFFAVVASQAIS